MQMMDLARSLESAELNAESYNSNSINPVVAAINDANNNSKKGKGCWNCGNNRHPKSACPAKDSVCRKCNRKGHFDKCCRSSKGNHIAAIMNDSSEEDQNKTTASAVFTPSFI